MKNSTFLISLLLLPLLMQAQADQFRGTNRDGIYPESDLLNSWPQDGPELVAEIKGIGDGYGSPSFNDRGLYIAGMEGSRGFLYHFDYDHRLKWKVEYGDEFTYKYTGARATPTLDGERLYYIGTYGDVLCLNNADGTVLWESDLFGKYGSDTIKWGFTESPLVYGDLVIFTPGAPGHNVVGLDKMNGELRWAMDLEGVRNAYNSPFLVNHRGKDLVVMNTSNHILLFHPLSGEVAYSHPLTESRGMHAISPLYLGDRIFYSSGYGEGSTMYRINEETGGLDTLWYSDELDCKLSGLIAVDGMVFGTADKRKQWVGLDLESGEKVFSTRELKPGSFLMTGGKFILYTETGEVALAEPSADGFTIISRFQVPAGPVTLAFAHPVIHQGMLYIRFREKLWVYRVVDR